MALTCARFFRNCNNVLISCIPECKQDFLTFPNSFLLKKEMEDPCIALFAIDLEGPFFVIGIFLIAVTWGFGFPSLVIDMFNGLDCKRMLMITPKTYMENYPRLYFT